MLGPGRISCGTVVEEAEGRNDISYFLAWTQGYLSAANQMRMNDGRFGAVALPDVGAIRGYLLNYCRQNPLSPVSAGAGALFLQLVVDQMRKQ